MRCLLVERRQRAGRPRYRKRAHGAGRLLRELRDLVHRIQHSAIRMQREIGGIHTLYRQSVDTQRARRRIEPQAVDAVAPAVGRVRTDVREMLIRANHVAPTPNKAHDADCRRREEVAPSPAVVGSHAGRTQPSAR